MISTSFVILRLEEQVFESYEQFLDDQYREETNFYADEISGIDDEKQKQMCVSQSPGVAGKTWDFNGEKNPFRNRAT